MRVFIIGMVMTVGTSILNASAEHHLRRQGPNWSHRLVEAKFELVDTAGGPADWLVLGDSSAAHGVRPDAWMREGPGEVWNLATVAGLGVTGDVWMLDRYLARFDAPEGVVLMHTVDVWDRAVDPGLAGQVPGSLAWFAGNRPWPEWSVGAWGRFALSRYVPLVAESGSLVSSLFGQTVPEGLRFSMDPKGWVRSRTPDAAQFQQDARSFAASLQTPSVPLSADNHQALAALGARCRAEDIRLYVVHAPVWEGVEAGMPARVRNIETQIARVLDPLDVHFVPRTTGLAETALESTVDHLRPEAATDFTLELVRELVPADAAPPNPTPAAAASDPPDARPR